MPEGLRKSGIDVIGDVPWGTHLCQFYRTEQDLLDILVPYFKAGLENNELCIWVTSDPIGVAEAQRAMAQNVPDLEKYLAEQQIQIMPYSDWYLKNGEFKEERVLHDWADKMDQALAKGFAGLRATGNTSWLYKDNWTTFARYEATVNDIIGKYKMLAICTYQLDKCSSSEILNVIDTHQFALSRREDKWDMIGSAVFHDIAERNKMELIKDEFIGMVSHELMTPLTIILGALHTVTDQRLSGDDTYELLQNAISGTEAMVTIVENLLELSRSQANRLQLQTQRADFSKIARNVVNKLQRKSSIHQVSIDLSRELPTVRVDPVRVERILYNLVENAIKYSPNGGEVKVAAYQENDNLVVCVSDQGPGISPDDQHKLFQSFEQLGISSRKAIQGLGLGLKVCHTLVEAHGGRIWVESEPGKGSVFYFTIPIKGAAAV